MIELTFEKVVTGAGERRYKLVKATGKSRRDLPALYQRGLHASFGDGFGDDCVYIFSDPNDVGCMFRVGNLLTEEEFADLVATLRKCGEHLHDVNAQLAALRAEWHGEVTVVI